MIIGALRSPTHVWDYMTMIDWTVEQIAALPTDRVKILRENASRLGETLVLTLCDAELSRRAPRREKTPRITNVTAESRHGQNVVGFHFVCPQEKGVTRNSDGTVWTGTWVVDKMHAERAARIGAYVALHTAKSELSYLQGVVKDWRKMEREQEYADGRPVKIEFGVDFLLELTDEPYDWKGDGSGEKGYVWNTPKETAGSDPAVA
jgi:hypothetical protein